MKLKPLSNSSFKMKFVPNLLPIFRIIEVFLRPLVNTLDQNHWKDLVKVIFINFLGDWTPYTEIHPSGSDKSMAIGAELVGAWGAGALAVFWSHSLKKIT